MVEIFSTLISMCIGINILITNVIVPYNYTMDTWYVPAVTIGLAFAVASVLQFSAWYSTKIKYRRLMSFLMAISWILFFVLVTFGCDDNPPCQEHVYIFISLFLINAWIYLRLGLLHDGL
jgi:hypothetical protein